MNPLDMMVDRTPTEKALRVEKIRAELKELLRQSVPSAEAPRYWELGWTYIMPDFDKPNHSIIEWQSDQPPVYPPRSDQQATESANVSDSRRQQPA